MKVSPLQLFLVLLLGLLLCSMLTHKNITEGLENNKPESSNVKKNFDPTAPARARDRVLYNDHTTIGANPLALDEGDIQSPEPIDNKDRSPQAIIRSHHHEHPLEIPRSQIQAGDEDLYILKSEIVPPVCPACPTATTCPRQEPCPPCPPCARCPEPAFECKKVPNYRNNNDMYLPRPVLADFSQFGM